jgi:hypothetical protein
MDYQMPAKGTDTSQKDANPEKPQSGDQQAKAEANQPPALPFKPAMPDYPPNDVQTAASSPQGVKQAVEKRPDPAVPAVIEEAKKEAEAQAEAEGRLTGIPREDESPAVRQARIDREKLAGNRPDDATVAELAHQTEEMPRNQPLPSQEDKARNPATSDKPDIPAVETPSYREKMRHIHDRNDDTDDDVSALADAILNLVEAFSHGLPPNQEQRARLEDASVAAKRLSNRENEPKTPTPQVPQTPQR